MGLDPITMGALITAGGSVLGGAMQPNPYQERVPYTGSASPQSNLANVSDLIKALLPGVVNTAQTPPSLRNSDQIDALLTKTPVRGLRGIPNFQPTQGSTPTRNSVSAIPGLDFPWGNSPGSRAPSADARYSGGKAVPRTPVSQSANVLQMPDRTAVGVGGGLDDRTLGALQLLKHAASMAPRGSQAA